MVIRQTNATGQFRSLKDRTTDAQQARRAGRIMGRRHVAEQLMQAAGYAIQQATEMKRRGFWGRLKLVLFGR